MTAHAAYPTPPGLGTSTDLLTTGLKEPEIALVSVFPAR